MHETQQPRDPKKTTGIVYAVILVVLLLLNFWAFPAMMKGQVKQVDYGTFLNMLEGGELSTVEIQDQQIYFVDKNDTTYCTNSIAQDLQLVNRLESAGVSFGKVYNQTTWVDTLLGWVISLLPMIILIVWFNRMMRKRVGEMTGGANSMIFGGGKSGAKQYVVEDGKSIKFADVAGEDEEKEELKEVVEFLKSPDKFNTLGARIPHGVLLVGPPGTGKTLLARACAGEAGVPFYSISGSDFVEMYVGVGASRVRDLFDKAKKTMPCIIFIDEIDAVGRQRGAGLGGGHDEREQTLNQLLSEMDGFDGSKGIVILAATNRPDSLDKALLRPGRFDRRIPVELPDLQGREAILRVHAKNIKTEPDIDYKAIARATSGASGAELANIVNEAALRAVRMHRESVTQSDFEESVEVVIAGYQRKGAVIPKEQKRIVAYHEIGHALVAARQKNSAPVHKITIVPRTSGALGYTMQVSEDDNVLMSKEELFNKITTLTGGRSAEEVIFKSITTGASNDIEQATRIARAMVTRFGMTDEFDMMATETVTNAYLGGDTSLACSETTSGKIDAKVMEIIKDAHAKARAILENDIEKLHELSAYLLEKETITGEEFMYILEHGRPETKNETSGEVIETTAVTADEGAAAKEPDAQAEETSTAE